MEKLKKIITEISRIILGSLFVLSGFVKAVDPLGSGYKFGEYFTAFGLSWLDPLALPLAFFLITFEFTLGVCILLGIYRKASLC